ncbi:MAG: PAS domain-containing protein [Chloroflexi bacterium]|nr:PAS domain-containing protein [Chloroflexota bacterium]
MVEPGVELPQTEGEGDRFFALAPDALFVVGFDGLIRRLNPACVRTLGFEATTLLGRPFVDLVHPDDRALAIAQIEKVIRKADSVEFETRHVCADGLSKLLAWRAAPDPANALIYAVGREATPAAPIVAEQEARFRAVFESAASGNALVTTLLDSLPAYAVLKDLNGSYVAANQRFCDAFGYSRLEIAGKTAHELFPKDLADKYLAEDTRVFESGEPSPFDSEQEIIDEGRRIPLVCRKIPLKDEGGGVVGLIGLGFDITERKRMEEQLRQAQRLETAGRVAGQVAHDLNNLLAPLAGYPELIKSQLPKGHLAEQFCDAMLEAAKEMAAINKKVMTLGRKAHFSLEPLELNTLVEDALSQMADLPETLAKDLDLANDLRPISGSSTQLLQVVSNLLSNARAAMRDTGLLSIRTENVLVEGRPKKSEDGPYVRLRVSDTGCGVPPDIKDNLFESFFMSRAGGNRRGSGLGLLIIESVVHDHHGFVTVESEPGKGTTFDVYLPQARELEEQKKSQRYVGGSETVLIIDDDDVQREVLGRLLQTLGYDVRSAASGEEAVAYLEDHKVDMLILDMIMPPGIDGAETYRQALEIRPKLPAIIVSGFAESERVHEAQELGAGAFLHKPVTLEELARAVRTELERKRRR